jgi:uncharacterized circularly permuted ATP-grasp superfamily protein/uncharacterized alpha-E superfamily protein
VSYTPLTDSEITFGAYQRLTGTYDGMWDGSGKVRVEWQSLLQSLQHVGKRELPQRYSQIQRQLRENGVTYNVYGDPEGSFRAWKLDALPFLINSAEWEFIEHALIQRARLLNFILKDIYGSRDLISNGALPLDLIYNHQGFIRPCNGISIPGSTQLFVYAADIARDKDGKLWILNDRTQAPSGSGYALENRSIMSKVMPELFNGYDVRKLTEYFNILHTSLMAVAPGGIPNPRIVILTPGPGNETYFEHAYLSAYLGYHLVQGEDLTVRDGFVWLKTIAGLEKVDIILRRVDDSFCDPLELLPGSRLGVSGLTEAARRGNVVLANPLGSSVLENPGIMAFLPGICKRYFNEELMIPSLSTWWCGQESELKFVLENLDVLNIKMIHRLDGSRTVSNGGLTLRKKEALKKQVCSKPYLYVAHERLGLSTTPSYIQGGLERRYAVIRCFLVASGDTYFVMPGGLTRSSAEKDVFKVSNQYGGISKDTWILGGESNNARKGSYSGIQSAEGHIALPSRIAENMFWTGRYATRAANTARYLREVLQKLYEQNPSSGREEKIARILLYSLKSYTSIFSAYREKDFERTQKYLEEELFYILLSDDCTGSLNCILQFLKRSIYAVRNRWSDDTWHIIEAIEESWTHLEHAGRERNLRFTVQALEAIIDSLVTFMGLNTEYIPRDHAYLLLNNGRAIEKALLLITQLRATIIVPQDDQVEYALMETILLSNMNLSLYRARFRSYLEMEAFLNLLIFDISNPSSLLYQISQLKENIPGLHFSNNSGRMSKEENLVIEAYIGIQKQEPYLLKQVNPQSKTRKELDNFLTFIFQLLVQFSDVMVADYFTHSELSEQL